MTTATIRRIAAHELFSGCRRAELAQIDQLGTTIDVRPGRTLCDEGAPGYEFFVLLAGDVVVRTAAGTVALLHAGGWFGELALLDGEPRRATVTATTHVTVIVFDRREFNCMIAVAPSVRARIWRGAKRLVDGDAPTRQAWYQPLPVTFPVMSFES
jgi:CRP-like cAMP-binding protein